MDAPLTRFQEVMYEKTRQSWPTARGLMHLTVCARIEGAIDIEIFERAARFLAARYPILCSRLVMKKDELIQRQDGGTPTFEVIDVGDDERKADILLSAQADKPFDLFSDNPFKVVLGQARPGVAFVLLVAHHIFIDEFALQLLFEQYIDLVTNPESGEVTLAGSDGDHDFFTWCLQQEKMACDGTYTRKAQYWIKYLDQVDPLLHFPERPTDPPRQNLSRVAFKLDLEATKASLDRSRRLGVSHNALAVNAIFHTLREFTGQRDITLTLVSNTRRPPFGRTVGQFAEAFLIRQRSDESKLDDRSTRLVFRDIVNGIKNYIPFKYFVDQLDWLKAQSDRKFASTEALVDYMPREADLNSRAERTGYKISRVQLGARARPPQPLFYGLVANFYLRPQDDGFSGLLEYESTLVSKQLAQQIITSLRDELARPAGS
jgi:condensation domain-containing protein